MLIALSIRIVLLFNDQDWYETIGMLISITLSSLISSLSEYGSNKAFNKLQSEYENMSVRVKRNNKMVTIKSDEVVVGDLVYLSIGEIVPADGIIISGSIGVDESSINGESIEVIKNVNDNILKGSIVLSNKCIMRVKNVGINTIYGDITKELSEKNPVSPMRIRLTKLAKTISRIGYVGAIIASLSFIFNILFINNNFNMDIIIPLLMNTRYMIDLFIQALTLSLTIILVCVPEGLPMMISLVLSSNMKKMLKDNVLVRKMVGIETCGSLNVLLLDKTGTLTKGNLGVIGVVLGNGCTLTSLSEMNDNYKSHFISSIIYNTDSIIENNVVSGGNSTDKALLTFVGNYNLNHKILEYKSFNSKDKYSYSLIDTKDKYYKGAKEILLKKCIYYYDEFGKKNVISYKNEIESMVSAYTKKGIRVISLVENNILIGFVLLRDEIREEASDVIKTLTTSGIHTIMITGDDIDTASSIAREIGMLDNESIVLNHDDLAKLSDDDILNCYKKIKVIARALPNDKSRVASILEHADIVVGMTGDGINDAPALKKANVGISLGSGTDVAKEASDIVILDDNIKSIENAILYGRTIFKSIRKFLIFQLTMNVCALFLSIVGPFIGVTLAITIMQMLWINMIMDTLAGLAFSYEPPLRRYLLEKPIKKDEPIINRYMFISILTIAIYSCVLLVLFKSVYFLNSFIRQDIKHIMTSFFSIFIFLSIFNAFNARTTRLNLFNGILQNKVFLFIIFLIFIFQIILIYFGGDLFRTYGLYASELIYVILLSSSVIIVDLIKKLIIRNR
jgi:calcium-translocating P-type ATPase